MWRLAFSFAFANLVCNEAFNNEVTPVEKVTTLLKGLQQKVNDEGRAEAKTYNTFACFCKTSMAKKNKAVADGKTQKDTLQTKINSDSSIRVKEGNKIAQTLKQISTLEADIQKAKANRRSQHLQYSQNEVELSHAVQALDGALASLKAAKGSISLSQLAPNEREAIFMAEALLPEESEHRANMLALLSTGAPSDKYGFKSSGVIDTLEKLKTDFRKQRNSLDKAETKDKQAHDMFVQNKQNALNDAKATLETAKKDQAKASARIADASQDLTTVAAELLDDQNYLAELAANCNEKAILWDQRSTARAQELQALTKAIDLIKSLPPPRPPPSVAPAPSAAAFVEELARISSAPAPAMTAPSFVQVSVTPERSPPRGSHNRSELPALQTKPLLLMTEKAPVQPHLRGTRARAVNLLREQAQVLRSSSLEALVEHFAADPFKKVKQLVTELIERLLDEAAKEGNHKGWCDKEYALAEQKRDTSADDMRDTNDMLEVDEARRDELDEDIPTLEREIKELNATLLQSTKLRQQESAENKLAIQDAKTGRDIVTQTIGVLQVFYKTAANQAAAAPMSAFLQEIVAAAPAPAGGFIQASQEPEYPTSGFDDAYAGSQGASVGVLGMLEVVKSDFDRSYKETVADEAKAAKAFDKLELETTISKNTKTQAFHAKKKARVEVQGEISKNFDKLTDSKQILTKALRQIEALDKACKPKGQSAAERKAKREEEIAALKKAYCVLSANGDDVAAAGC